MKTVMLVDGGPRKNMNTTSLADSFAQGLTSLNGIEVRRIRLYGLNYRGCMSCLACKLRGKSSRICVFPDDLKPVLEDISRADGLALATPIYLGDMTAQMRAFLERLIFAWLSYEDFTMNAPRRMPLAFLYTMNASEEYLPMLDARLKFTEDILSKALGESERVMACFTSQVRDYSKYEMAGCDPEARACYRAEHWEKDLAKAFDAGRRMAEKILA